MTSFLLTIVSLWEGGGPLRRAEEVVHILFARVLLLSAPLSKYRQLKMEVCIFAKFSKLRGRGNIQPINFNLDYYYSTFATKLLFSILKW